MKHKPCHQWIAGSGVAGGGRRNQEFWINKFVSISFNPAPPTSFQCNEFGPAETTIVFEVNGKAYYLILEGDFRVAYEEAFKQRGCQGILDLFLALRSAHENDWSILKRVSKKTGDRLLKKLSELLVSNRPP